MSTSIADVIDGLVTVATNSAAAGTEVKDGESNEVPRQGVTYLVIGNETGETGTGSIEEGEIGAFSMWEDYTIGCRIEYNDGSTDQKACRDKVINAYKTFLTAVQGNPHLSGALNAAGWIRPVAMNYTQTTEDDLEQGGEGRRAQLDFVLQVRNLLQLS